MASAGALLLRPQLLCWARNAACAAFEACLQGSGSVVRILLLWQQTAVGWHRKQFCMPCMRAACRCDAVLRAGVVAGGSWVAPAVQQCIPLPVPVTAMAILNCPSLTSLRHAVVVL